MKRVLVVDDARFKRMIMKEMLWKGGYEVVGEGNNGIVAIDLLDGISALKKIKELDRMAKVIFCTAVSD